VAEKVLTATAMVKNSWRKFHFRGEVVVIVIVCVICRVPFSYGTRVQYENEQVRVEETCWLTWLTMN
jgi:hypothetical protein